MCSVTVSSCVDMFIHTIIPVWFWYLFFLHGVILFCPWLWHLSCQHYSITIQQPSGCYNPVFPLQPNVPHFVEESGTANLQFLQFLHLKVFLGTWHNCLLEIWAVFLNSVLTVLVKSTDFSIICYLFTCLLLHHLYLATLNTINIFFSSLWKLGDVWQLILFHKSLFDSTIDYRIDLLWSKIYSENRFASLQCQDVSTPCHTNVSTEEQNLHVVGRTKCRSRMSKLSMAVTIHGLRP
jgi:hypothetical protein